MLLKNAALAFGYVTVSRVLHILNVELILSHLSFAPKANSHPKSTAAWNYSIIKILKEHPKPH
jgi:hypothetical protein